MPKSNSGSSASPLPKHELEYKEDVSNTELELGLTKTLAIVMANNLMVAINDRLKPVTKAFLHHTNHLKRANKPTG